MRLLNSKAVLKALILSITLLYGATGLNAQFQYGATLSGGKSTYYEYGNPNYIGTSLAGKVGGTVRYLFKGEKNKLFLQSGLRFETNGGSAPNRHVNTRSAPGDHNYQEETGFSYRFQSMAIPLEVGFRMELGNGRALSMRTGIYASYGLHAKVTMSDIRVITGETPEIFKPFSYNPFKSRSTQIFNEREAITSKELLIFAQPIERKGMGISLGADFEIDEHWLINADWQQLITIFYVGYMPRDGAFKPGMCTLGLTYLF